MAIAERHEIRTDYQLSWLSENRENGPTMGELGPNPLAFPALHFSSLGAGRIS